MAANQNKYDRIFADLRAKIWSGYYPANQQLPSENELAQTYQVSRITSKRALQELAANGLVQRRQGSGTFVRAGLRPKKLTNRILLVIPFAPDSGLGDYITGIKTILTPQKDLIIMENQQFDTLSPHQVEQQYDGIIYYPQNLSAELAVLNPYLLMHLPLVLLDQTATGLPLPAVVADNVQGGQLATQTLIDAGHRHIAFLASSNFRRGLNSSVAQRYFGYLRAFAQNDLSNATSPQQAYRLTQAQFQRLLPWLHQEKITALVMENDLLALKVLHYLQQNHVQVPEAISLIGFDNITETRNSQPQLSTITQDFAEIGQHAAELLQQRLDNPFAPQIQQITVPVNLKLRHSIQKLK